LADFGDAGGAFPPAAPPPLLSVVVVVPVVSVDDVSVDDDPVVSGTVVVIVVTPVELPVVTVEMIVVVACDPNGAAPAVKAAVAAPSVTNTANAALQATYFLYLLIPPPLSGRQEGPTHLATELLLSGASRFAGHFPP
jgi:hypothetical protein